MQLGQEQVVQDEASKQATGAKAKNLVTRADKKTINSYILYSRLMKQTKAIRCDSKKAERN
jgi:hypothetical protein